MRSNAIAAPPWASPWQRTALSPLEVSLYEPKFTIFITLPSVILSQNFFMVLVLPYSSQPTSPYVVYNRPVLDTMS
jgi:hypothetical protein